MTRRLHAACPACQRAEALRPDGTMLQHTAPDARSGRWRVCPGTGRDPGADAVRAWLAGHESDAADAVRRAQAALTRAQAELAEADREHAERAAWCARERGRL